MKGVDSTSSKAVNTSAENVEAAVYKYAPMLNRLAFAYVKSVHDAEDVVQEVFLAYLKKMPKFENDEHEKAWLLRVTINKSRNARKSAWFKKRSELEEIEYISDEKRSILESVLALKEKYRLPIHLHYYSGYSINEIAAILGEKPATIGTRLARGRKLLKKTLEGDFEDET